MADSPIQKALSIIDAAHADDPTLTPNTNVPYELHYARKCTDYLYQHTPSPSNVLQLAIRAQHLRRWEIPRSSYPMTKAGYYSWRTFLKKRQADLALQYCKEGGVNDADAERVAALVRKEDLKSDEETQVLEDVACLVFLDDQFEEFEKSHDEEKIIGILRKTWGKMSERGRELALEMKMEGRPKELITKALSGE